MPRSSARPRFPGRVLRLAAAVSLACSAGAALAEILYWDPNVRADGIGGSGTWDDSSPRWSLVSSGVPQSGRASVWQDGAGVTAAFGGEAGEVALSGVRSAGEVVFATTGYSLTGGRLVLDDLSGPSGGGTIRVLDGVSAKLTTALGPRPTGAGVESGPIDIAGSGTLTLALTESFAGTLTADTARIQATADSLSGAMLILRGTRQQFSALGASGAVRIGGIQTSARHDFGFGFGEVLELAGVNSPGAESRFLGGLNASGLRLGVERSTSLTLGSTQLTASQVDLGFLEIVNGTVTVQGAEVTIEARFGQSGSRLLLVGAGSSMTVSGVGSSVDVQGTAEVLRGGLLEVTDGAVLRVSPLPPSAGGGSLLAVGDGDSRAELAVSGAGSRVIVDDTLRLGSRTGASARARVGGGGELVASTLAFASDLNTASTSQLLIGNRGTARFRQIDSTLAKGDLGTITIQDGTLIVGEVSIAGPGVSHEYSFRGVLEGGGGLLRKVDDSAFGLYGETGLFAGRVSVEGGELRVAPRTLARATLSVSGTGRFSAPFPDATLTVGALDGQFDLALPGTSLLLEGDGDGSWRGSFTYDRIAVLKTLGTGVQSFAGAVDGSVMAFARLDVQSAGVRFVGGQFRVADDGGTGVVQAFGVGRFIDVAGGARVNVVGDVSITGGASLTVQGKGTSLDIVPVDGRSGGGLALGGTVRVTNSASLRAEDLFIPVTGISGGTSTVTVDKGGAVFADFLDEATTGKRGTLVFTVDGGTMTVGRVLLAPLTAGSRVMSLSDPGPGTPALTVGLDRQGRAVDGDSHLGTLQDATGGPGSVRMAGLGTLTFDAPLAITGELVVDTGHVKLAHAADLATVLVRLGSDDALDLSVLAADAVLRFAALGGTGDLDVGTKRGLTLGSTDRAGVYSGQLRVGGTLTKTGQDTQVLAGDVTAGQLEVQGSTLELRGGTTRTGAFNTGAVNVMSTPTAGGALKVTEGGWLDVGALDTLALSAGIRTTSLTVTGAGSRLTAGQVVVDSQHGSVSFADGARVDLTLGFELAEGASLNVSRATLVTGPEVSVRTGAVVSISDAIPAVGQDVFSAPVAWTVRPYRNFAPSGALAWGVPVRDGAAGSGSLAFSGNDAQVRLGTAATHTGRTIVDGSGMLLLLPTSVAARQLVAMNGGTLGFDGPTFTASITQSFHTDATGVVQWGGVTLTGGTLHGAGHRVDGSAASFTNTILAADARLTATAPLLWNGGDLQGQLVAQNTVDLGAVTIRAGGELSLGGSSTLRTLTNRGTLRIVSGGSASLANALNLEGSSLVEVASGGTLGGDFIQVSGGRLVNDGHVTSAVVVTPGGRAGGNGTFDVVLVSGGTFAPGHSPGHATTTSAVLGAGGHYEVEMNDATGAAGVGFDLWSVPAAAKFSGIEGGSPFVFDLVSLASDDAPGITAHFDASRSWRWTVFEAGTFEDYQEGDVVLDTARFQAPGHGRFSLVRGIEGGYETLSIVYAPVPEPGTIGLVGLGLVALLARRRMHPRA